MEKYIFNNGLRLIYEYKKGALSSFTIGFNAGALEEEEYSCGTAHALEHMLYKGTKNRNETEINIECDKLFGFNNAMTNYPYTIYYGTLMSEEFEKGIDLYTDIILNPTLSERGFEEEIDVILEELKEWKDDPYQFCEDELFYNSFRKRRIRYPIIGTSDSIRKISLSSLQKFYSTYYVPSNCVISVVSSLEFNTVLNIIAKYCDEWNAPSVKLQDVKYETNREGIFVKPRDINGAKIYYCFPIHNLGEDEVIDVMIINNILGSGTSSILYDAVRTRNGLAYDISSLIKNERGIKMLEISLGTSYSNALRAVEIINRCIEQIGENERFLKKVKVEDAIKSIKLRRMVSLEKSVELSKALTTYELMYGASEKIYNEMELLNFADIDKLIETARKVLNRPSIQIIGQ